jgi:hypothetical protein
VIAFGNVTKQMMQRWPGHECVHFSRGHTKRSSNVAFGRA